MGPHAYRELHDKTFSEIDPDPKLRADLRGTKNLVTSAGNIRFLGESDDSHCDRFRAKALRHHGATRKQSRCGAAVVYDHWDNGWSGGYTSTSGIIAGLAHHCR